MFGQKLLGFLSFLSSLLSVPVIRFDSLIYIWRKRQWYDCVQYLYRDSEEKVRKWRHYKKKKIVLAPQRKNLRQRFFASNLLRREVR